MAEKKTAVDTGKVETVTTAKKAKAVSEPMYKLDVMRKHCRELFGVSTAAFVGATTGIAEKQYTVGEIRSMIEIWQKQEVK